MLIHAISGAVRGKEADGRGDLLSVFSGCAEVRQLTSSTT